MKIVHLVLSDVFAGIEQHVNELSLEQQLHEDVEIICNKEISKGFDLKKVISINNFNRRSPFGIIKLLLLITKKNADIIHTHGSKTTSIINMIKKFIKVNHVTTLHGIKKNTNPYKKANKVIAVSDSAQKSLDIKCEVIKNWWSPNLPNHIDNKKEYALAIGRLEKVKGFDLLIESWVGIGSNLVIVGSGKEYKNLSNLIKLHSLESKISIVDDVPFGELIEYYSNASILIVSSRNEGGPRVALEALRLKVPVISTDVGHMKEILPVELLAVPDDLNSLKELVHRYVGNESMNQDSIYKYVTEEYSIKAQSKKVHQVYKDLLVS